MFRDKIGEIDFGVWVDKKVSESTQCDGIVRKANAISGYDHVSLHNI